MIWQCVLRANVQVGQRIGREADQPTQAARPGAARHGMLALPGRAESSSQARPRQGSVGLAGELRCHQQPTPRPSFSVGPCQPRRGREAVPDSGRGGWLFLESQETLACEVFGNCFFFGLVESLAPSIPDVANFVGGLRMAGPDGSGHRLRGRGNHELRCLVGAIASPITQRQLCRVSFSTSTSMAQQDKRNARLRCTASYSQAEASLSLAKALHSTKQAWRLSG